MALILASKSPRRKELLEKITKDFTIEVSSVDEKSIHAPDSINLVRALAKAKCLAVAKDHPQDWVIGCDTVVDCDGDVLGKPINDGDAFRMLRMLSGRVHMVHTGVCIAHAGKLDLFSHTSRVEFYDMSDKEIWNYIATGEPADKAGAYAIQGGASVFCKGIQGDYYSIMGLPVAMLNQHLKNLGAL